MRARVLCSPLVRSLKCSDVPTQEFDQGYRNLTQIKTNADGSTLYFLGAALDPERNPRADMAIRASRGCSVPWRMADLAHPALAGSGPQSRITALTRAVGGNDSNGTQAPCRIYPQPRSHAY